MPRKRKTTKTQKNQTKKKSYKMIELEKETPTSVIAVTREQTLDVQIITPTTLDGLYANVPEVSRAIDLRGAAIIYRGYEIQAADDSEEAKKFANICSFIVNRSGGVNFFEQWQKNADLYGNGYVEMVDDGGKITSLEHVHAFNFGYELEEFIDPLTFETRTRIKLDPETQKPVGYATYKLDPQKDILVNDKLIEKTRIAHLKYKLVGDALLGVSLIQPMRGSIDSKLRIEDSIESAARLVSAPKIVIEGDFASNEEAMEQAKEAANLDVNDVIILQDGKKFSFVNPGDVGLPALREIFVVNITTASGIPRPILTSESAQINKATMQELMRQLRENMRSNMGKMTNIIEQKIFKTIGESYGITDFQNIIPVFRFPEDADTEEEIIVREERKAATITSMSNSLVMLNNMLLGKTGTPANASMKTEIEESMGDMFVTLNETMRTFNVNNDQIPSKIEEEIPEDVSQELSLSEFESLTETPLQGQEALKEETADSVDITSLFSTYTLDEPTDQIRQPEFLKMRHDLLHQAYEALVVGAEIFDIQTGIIITIPALVNKHKYYVHMMQTVGSVHEVSEIGTDLDEML